MSEENASIARLETDVGWIKDSIMRIEESLALHPAMIKECKDDICAKIDAQSERIDKHDDQLGSLEKWRTGIVAVGIAFVGVANFVSEEIRSWFFKR